MLTFPLSLSYFHTLQYKKAQASFWTAGTFQSSLLPSSSFFLLSYLCSSRISRVEISKINLSPFTDSLSLSLSRIRQQSHRGSRFARRFEALGKAHPGREALHLARVGVLRRFGWDCLGKLGRPFHEGDPNPRGTFSSFALSLSLSKCVHPFLRTRILRAFVTTRTPHSPKSTLFTGASVLWIPNCHREHPLWYVYAIVITFSVLILGGEKIFRCSSFSLSFLRLLMTSRGRKKLTRVKNFHHRIHNRNVLSPHRSIHQGSGGKDEIVQGGRYDPVRAKKGGMGLEMGA